MGIYNVLDDISKKQILKTEGGDNRIFGVVVGIVTKNYSEKLKGRVCVQIPTRDATKDKCYWCRVAMPSSGKKYGHYFLPEIGDQVLVVFEHGNIERPYVIGCIPHDNDKFLTDSVKEKNSIKRIVTRNGNSIVFTDDDESNADGDKDKIEIFTPKQEHKLILDNKAHMITLSHKDPKKASVNMKTDSGEITIQCEKKLMIKVGDKITMTFSGDNGTVEINATNFKVKDVTNVEMVGSSKFNVQFPNSTMEGSTAVKLVGGSAKISGSTISLE